MCVPAVRFCIRYKVPSCDSYPDTVGPRFTARSSATAMSDASPAEIEIVPATPIPPPPIRAERLRRRLIIATCLAVLFFILSLVLIVVLATRPTAAPTRPSMLVVFDTDYTLFGLAGSVLNSPRTLWAEPFYDGAFLQAPGPFGNVWGMSRGMVPDLERLRRESTLGPESFLSVLHPDFGEQSPFDVRFAVLSDGDSLSTEFGRAFESNVTDQRSVVRSVRGALDFNPRWHIIDGATSWSCYGRYDATTSQTDEEYRLTPVQEHCSPYGHKDIMMQNILDFYKASGAPKFQYVLFVDDQAKNLRIVKTAPNLGPFQTLYAWGDEQLCAAQNECVYLAYPTGRTVYEVRPTGDGSWPCCCGGCTYASVSSPAEVSAYQASTAGLGIEHFYSEIDQEDGTLRDAFGVERLREFVAS